MQLLTNVTAPTVLLVEDDPPIRQLIRRMLEARAYRVLEARSGKEAVVAARRCQDPIDLLIADVILPDFDGFTVTERLAPLHPETRVLYMSGYAQDSVAVRGGLRESQEPYLWKPFTAEELERKVREVLDAGTREAQGLEWFV